MLFGAHESVAGGLHLAFERIERVGGKSLQIFTRNQRQWFPKPLVDQEVEAFAAAWHLANKLPVFSHCSYLINLASQQKEVLEKSIDALVFELERCSALGIADVVLHPGSHGGDGVEQGIDRFVLALDKVFERNNSSVRVLLETTAGQGTGLGASFDELGRILTQSRFSERLGICVDTCHIFAAGYDIRTQGGYNQTITELHNSVGLHRVKLFHLNDSKKGCGSRVDRHEHIGEGMIGLEGFRLLVNDPRFTDIPMTLETPKGEDLSEDIKNLNRLYSLQERRL